MDQEGEETGYATMKSDENMDTMTQLLKVQQQTLDALHQLNSSFSSLASKIDQDEEKNHQLFKATRDMIQESFMNAPSGSRQPWSSTPYPSNSASNMFSPEMNVINSWQQSRNNTTAGGRASSNKTDIPRQKLPTYDGSDEWVVFLFPFERAASRMEWSESEKLDRLFECMKGDALRYLCRLPVTVRENYPSLLQQMESRFGTKQTPAAARKCLAEVRQKGEKAEEFAEEVRKLTVRAYPNVGLEFQDELAAEAFLKGYRNARVGYEALNRQPKTLAEALDHVVQLEHNYKATLGRDRDSTHLKSRRVSFAESDTEDESCDEGTFAARRVNYRGPSTTDTLSAEIEKLRKVLEQVARQHSEKDQGSNKKACYSCGEEGHFRQQCPRRSQSRSPSPNRQSPSRRQQVLKVGRPTSRRALIVPVCINDVPADAVVDTGAEVTVLSKSFADKLGIDYRNNQTIEVWNAEEDKPMLVFDKVRVNISIGEKSVTWSLIVAPIHDNILLGLEFLAEVDGVVLARQGDLLVDGKLVNGKDTQSGKVNVSRVLLEQSIDLPPKAESIVVGRVCDPCIGKIGVLDPSSLKSGVQSGSVLVEMKEQIPVRMLNPTDSPVHLHQGTQLGKLVEAAEEEINTRESDDDNQAVDTESQSHAPISTLDHLQVILKNVDSSLENSAQSDLAQLLEEYQQIFARTDDDLGLYTGVVHKIDTGDAKPIRQPVRRTPLSFQQEEKTLLDQLLNSGVVKESKSEWASPVVLVRKKDGSARWCIDYRKVNAVSSKNLHPLPNIEDCLDALSGPKWFSTLDLQSGYHQIGISEEDQHKTAFITKFGLFEYTRMPFGLSGAPGTFQRAMELVLHGLQWDILLIYLDDVIIASNSVEEHLQHLQLVFERFQENNLKLKPKKCKLFQTRVLFLGHVISAETQGAENSDSTTAMTSTPRTQSPGVENQGVEHPATSTGDSSVKAVDSALRTQSPSVGNTRTENPANKTAASPMPRTQSPGVELAVADQPEVVKTRTGRTVKKPDRFIECN